MKTALIACGAIGRELLAIVKKHDWDADVVGISARHHVSPHRIAPEVESRMPKLKEKYERIILVMGDCGTYGALNQLAERHHIPILAGAHCYELYSGERYQQWATEDAGTYFLTDFLVRTFDATVAKSMGLDRYPELKDVYFANYHRLIYLVQSPDEALMEKARKIAEFLELPLQIEVTGSELLEAQLVELMTDNTPVIAENQNHYT
ncbi:MAG: DUF1638 domain-containing protein [Anaerolineaceae bacterium]|nr:DUF1638 domain-containing protein [Anaerolineaceae bacterium]